MDMPTLENLPASQDIAIILGVSASLAWAWTEWAKTTLKGLRKDGKDSWVWQQGMRALAGVFGGAGGWLIGGWPWGLILGLIGAANSAVIVGIVKARIRAVMETAKVGTGQDEKPPADDTTP